MRYVSLIQDGRIHTSEVTDFPCDYSTQEELVSVVTQLIDKGFAFVDEPAGWPPAEMLRELNEKMILNRSFTAIIWSGPEVFRLYEVPQR